MNRPHTIARSCDGVWLADGYKQTTLSHVAELCEQYKAVIIKPSVGSSGGHGISFWKEEDGSIGELLGQYKNCVVQELIDQHEELAEIHPESINTIRIMSMILDGEVRILSAILRMGVGSAKVDNVSSGGVACGIDKDGKLKQTSWNAK